MSDQTRPRGVLNRRKVIGSLVVVVALCAGAGGAYAAQRASGPAAVAPDAVFVGNVHKVKAVVSAANDASTNSTTTPTTMPGMSMIIVVPTGTTAVVDARFSAETSCSGGGTASNWCIAQILIDGVEAAPGDGTDFAFSATDSGNNTVTNWTSNAMERVATVSAGKHKIQVVGSVTDFNTTGSQVFWTGERALVVNY